MAGLEVQVGADAAEFEAEIAKVEAKIKNLEKQKRIRISIDADTGDLDKKILAANASLDKLKNGLDKVKPSVDKFNANTRGAGNTLTQFSRIAQDAPFGIIGIGNNLTATAEAFANLNKETGSTKASFKALGQSLMGAGGILLAISLVTSGLTYMAQKGLTLGDVIDKLTGNFDQARRTMQELNVEAAKNAQAQISSVGGYVYAAKNINLSMQERLIAVKKLQDEYPLYFGNLTKEQILNGDVAKAVQEVTAALINKAKAAAYVGKIVELAEQEEKIQGRINNEIIRQARLSGLSNNEAFLAAKLINSYLKGQIELGDVIQKNGSRELYLASIRADAMLRSGDALQDLGKELRSNIALQDKYTDRVNKSTAAQIKLEYQAEKAAKKTYDTPQVSGVGNVTPNNSLVDLNTIATFNGQLDEFKNKIRVLPGEISTSFKGVRQNISTELLESLKLMYEFNSAVDQLVKGSLTKTFEDLGSAIGTALAEGKNVFAAIGNTLISALGNFISDMGSLLIKYGSLAVAKGVIDKALTSGNPVVTIGAGVAAIAVGVALKGVGSAISSKASGGGSLGSASTGSTGASYSSPGSSSNIGGSSSSSAGGGTVVFEISGTSLIGVLNNTLDRNNRLGGSLSIS